MMMSLLWYYRPEHTDQGRQRNDCPDEVYASRHRDHNSVACIEDKCYVLTFSEYCRWVQKKERTSMNPNWNSNSNHFTDIVDCCVPPRRLWRMWALCRDAAIRQIVIRFALCRSTRIRSWWCSVDVSMSSARVVCSRCRRRMRLSAASVEFS